FLLAHCLVSGAAWEIVRRIPALLGLAASLCLFAQSRLGIWEAPGDARVRRAGRLDHAAPARPAVLAFPTAQAIRLAHPPLGRQGVRMMCRGCTGFLPSAPMRSIVRSA